MPLDRYHYKDGYYRIRVGKWRDKGQYPKEEAKQRESRLILFLEEQGIVTPGRYSLVKEYPSPAIRRRHYKNGGTYLTDEERTYFFEILPDTLWDERKHTAPVPPGIEIPAEIRLPKEFTKLEEKLREGEEIKVNGEKFTVYINGVETRTYQTSYLKKVFPLALLQECRRSVN